MRNSTREGTAFVRTPDPELKTRARQVKPVTRTNENHRFIQDEGTTGEGKKTRSQFNRGELQKDLGEENRGRKERENQKKELGWSCNHVICQWKKVACDPERSQTGGRVSTVLAPKWQKPVT